MGEQLHAPYMPIGSMYAAPMFEPNMQAIPPCSFYLYGYVLQYNQHTYMLVYSNTSSMPCSETTTNLMPTEPCINDNDFGTQRSVMTFLLHATENTAVQKQGQATRDGDCGKFEALVNVASDENVEKQQ